MRPLFLGELVLALRLAGGIALQAGRNAPPLGSSALVVGFVAPVHTLRMRVRPGLCSRLPNWMVLFSSLRGLSSIGDGSISSLGLSGISPPGHRLRRMWLDCSVWLGCR